MQKAGGIIGLVAGIFGVLAAMVILLIGGIGTSIGGQGAQTVIGLGWGGVLFSFLIIIFGAISMSARSKIPGAFLTLSSIAGAILGGTLVAIFMALAFVGVFWL
jgi:hypothetical protein